MCPGVLNIIVSGGSVKYSVQGTLNSIVPGGSG